MPAHALTDIPCLSLWQPWASLIVLGHKRIETRSWQTRHRGPLLIHAGRARSDAGEQLFRDHRLSKLAGMPKCFDQLPFGAVVGVVAIKNCASTEELIATECVGAASLEQAFGDFGPGRFGWLLDDAAALERAVPAVGRQSLFRLDDRVLKAVGRALPVSVLRRRLVGHVMDRRAARCAGPDLRGPAGADAVAAMFPCETDP